LTGKTWRQVAPSPALPEHGAGRDGLVFEREKRIVSRGRVGLHVDHLVAAIMPPGARLIAASDRVR